MLSLLLARFLMTPSLMLGYFEIKGLIGCSVLFSLFPMPLPASISDRIEALCSLKRDI